jgi:voltage-gated potassium channel Kch
VNWRAARPIVVVAAGLGVIVLGTIGYLDKHPEYDFFDASYRAIGLFGLTGNEAPPIPWTLQVARLLGPVVFGYAALQALLALFRQELRLLAIRLFARDHVVVAGLGAKGFLAATALHADGHHVIVIDRDADNPRAAGLRERGITVLTGDATDPEMLRRAQTGLARHLLAVCGEDGTNVDIAGAAEQLAAKRRHGALSTLAHLNDDQLWMQLSGAAIGSDQPTHRLEFFNVHALGARALVEHHPPLAPHVMIAGQGGVGDHLVLRVAGAWRAARENDRRLRVTLAGPESEAQLAALRAAHPELDELCELVVQPDYAAPDVPPARVYVSLLDEAAALTTALDLRAALPGVPIVVAVSDEESGVARALRAEGRGAGTIAAFGVLSRALSPELLHQADTEVLARAKHDEYVRAEARRGTDAQDNPSLKPWDELPRALKESNRRFADGISAKLEAAGCVLVPAPLADPERPGFAFDPAEVEELAIGEHDRWVADLLRDGWRPTTGAKDPERRLHPLLVGWDELSEAERDLDREPVREIPAMLARAGFRIARVSPGSAPRSE